MHPIADLYDIETRIEYALRQVISAGLTYAPIPAIFLARSDDTASTPRVEIRCTSASRSSAHVGPMNELDDWNCDIEIDVITDRTVISQDLRGMRGMIRYLLDRRTPRMVSPVLTYWVMCDLEAVGSSTDVESDEREDWSRLRYRGHIGMDPSAFPATVP